MKIYSPITYKRLETENVDRNITKKCMETFAFIFFYFFDDRKCNGSHTSTTQWVLFLFVIFTFSSSLFLNVFTISFYLIPEHQHFIPELTELTIKLFFQHISLILLIEIVFKLIEKYGSNRSTNSKSLNRTRTKYDCSFFFKWFFYI